MSNFGDFTDDFEEFEGIFSEENMEFDVFGQPTDETRDNILNGIKRVNEKLRDTFPDVLERYDLDTVEGGMALGIVGAYNSIAAALSQIESVSNMPREQITLYTALITSFQGLVMSARMMCVDSIMRGDVNDR
jgi:hypothetical protein